MTDAIDNGGPAFPTEPNTQPGFYQHHGMSLRDYFAGQALAGLLADRELKGAGVETDDEFLTRIARRTYAYADAMIAARKVQP